MKTPNLPEELDLLGAKKEYSLRTDLKVNGWGYLAMIISFTGDVLLPRHKDWHVVLRTIIALAPVVPALLWGRIFAQWIRGMDELHRRITLEVCLLATTATLFFFTALHPLDKAGVFQAIGLHAGLDLHTWWGASWLMVCFYILGSKILNRRYR